MQHALPAEDQPTQADASAFAGSTGMLPLFSDVGLLVALLAACLATAGSLFFSEVWGWIPCVLCWYQRILMYPLVQCWQWASCAAIRQCMPMYCRSR